MKRKPNVTVMKLDDGKDRVQYIPPVKGTIAGDLPNLMNDIRGIHIDACALLENTRARLQERFNRFYERMNAAQEAAFDRFDGLEVEMDSMLSESLGLHDSANAVAGDGNSDDGGNE